VVRAAASAATRSGAAGVAGGNCTDLGIRKSERTLPWRCTAELLLKLSCGLAHHRPIKDAFSQCGDILAPSPRNAPYKGTARPTATARRATGTQKRRKAGSSSGARQDRADGHEGKAHVGTPTQDGQNIEKGAVARADRRPDGPVLVGTTRMLSTTGKR